MLLGIYIAHAIEDNNITKKRQGLKERQLRKLKEDIPANDHASNFSRRKYSR